MAQGGARIGAGRKPKDTPPVAFTPGLPDPPSWLPSPARAYYRRYGGELAQSRVITHADRDILAAYAATLAELAVLTRLMRAKAFQRVVETKVGPKTNPIVTQWGTATSRARQLAQDLGLTPASRGRVKPVTPAEGTERKDWRAVVYQMPTR